MSGKDGPATVGYADIRDRLKKAMMSSIERQSDYGRYLDCIELSRALKHLEAGMLMMKVGFLLDLVILVGAATFVGAAIGWVLKMVGIV